MLRGLAPDRTLPPWQGAASGLVLSLFAAGVRLCLSVLVQDQTPYAVFFAAVLFATLLGGFAGGISAAVSGALLANWAFVEPAFQFHLTLPSLAGAATYLAVSGLIIAVTHSMVVAVHRERALNHRLSLVGRELEHRVKNVLSVVQTLVRQSARGAASAEVLRDSLEERLAALAAAQSLLARSEGQAAPLGALIEEVLSPYGLGDRILARDGVETIDIPAETAVGLALVLNELATNAVKYGALGQGEGLVRLDWRREPGWIALDWVEEGGPAVTAPQREGFGSRLFRGVFPPSDGWVKLDFSPTGLKAALKLRLAGAGPGSFSGSMRDPAAGDGSASKPANNEEPFERPAGFSAS